MNTLTEKQVKSLETEIYGLLMQNPEMGMGEMGDCREAAENIVWVWMKKENITVKD